MHKIILLIAAIVLSSTSFAGLQNSSFSKNSPALNALSSSWKTHEAVQPKLNPNDITMGYAGKDISRKPTIVPLTAVA